MNSAAPMRGIFAIPPTPFREDRSLDEEGLRRCVVFCLEAGCHGLVVPVNASEFAFLSDQERRRVVEIVARQTGGAAPVVAGVTASCAELAVELALHAQDAGVSALIAMPPHVIKASPERIRDYYARLAAVAAVPLFVQNYVPPVGTPMSAEFMVQLVRDLPRVEYIKEETAFSSHMISDIRRRAAEVAPGKFRGVMGGKAGRYVIEEHRRGACGNMPACEVADVQVKIWNALEAGDETGAAALFNAVLPLLNMEAVYGAALYKEVLRRRGVLDCAVVRQVDGRDLDHDDLAEFERVMRRVEPLFTVRQPRPAGRRL